MTKEQLIQDLRLNLAKSDRHEYILNVIEPKLICYLEQFEKNLIEVCGIIDYQIIFLMLTQHSEFAKFMNYVVEILVAGNLIEPEKIIQSFLMHYNNNFKLNSSKKIFIFSYYNINDI